MGGRAFNNLYCPRISRELYLEAREQTTDALSKLFKHVVVPTEMPSKTDYGDIDFLASGFFHTPTASALNWPAMVSAIKAGFKTIHGRQGFFNKSVMYFAIPAPGREDEFWIQVDVKVCDFPDKQTFEWARFQLNYASGAKIIGSIIKPLGLTISPEGLHLRVQEIEDTNFPGSMVFVSKEPLDALQIVGLDRRILRAGFRSNEEIYEYFSLSWLFNPAHFAKRMGDDKYLDHLEDRSAPWVYFVTQWISQKYPDYRFSDQVTPLEEWYRHVRAAVREKVFTLFPSITLEYYTKRGIHLKEVEEQRLRGLLMDAIPCGQDGWRDDLQEPHIILKSTIPMTPPQATLLNDPAIDLPSITWSSNSNIASNVELPPTPPSTPPSSVWSFPTDTLNPPKNPLYTPLYLQTLPRTPPVTFTVQPPPQAMSIEAKLLCLARWTYFDSETGAPYLAREPREKKFDMRWTDSGASDEVLVEWAQEMWWGIWKRQSWVNYVGMWKRRFEKEDAKAAKEAQRRAVEEEAVREATEKRERILGRLKALNEETAASE